MNWEKDLKGDYEDFIYFKENDVKEWILMAEKYIRMLEKYIEKAMIEP